MCNYIVCSEAICAVLYAMLIVADGMVYAADVDDRRILAVNLETLNVTVLHQFRDDFRPYTIAASERYIYFSAWNRK